MFRIGEFSKLTQVSVRMLRYYDEAGLLKPQRVDISSGYRFYSSNQIPVLNKILFLRDTGFTVAEITDTLAHWGDDAVADRLDKKRREVERTIASEQDRLAKIEMAVRDIRQKKIAIHCNVSIKSIPAYRVLSLRRVIPDYYAEGVLWKELCEFTETNGIHAAKNGFSIYYDTDYREKEVDVEVCALIEETGTDTNGFTFRYTEAVETMACTMVYGGFEHIAGVWRSFADWLAEHTRYRMSGPDRQLVHRGPWNEGSPDTYVTEIQVPLEKI